MTIPTTNIRATSVSYGSVTVVGIGFVNNLCDLLRSHGDLIAAKMKVLVQSTGALGQSNILPNHASLSA